MKNILDLKRKTEENEKRNQILKIENKKKTGENEKREKKNTERERKRG